MTPEQQARQQIDAQLVACSWAIQDYAQFNPAAAHGIALREVPLKSGQCDYLLLVDRKPVGVIEAKKEGTLLSGVAEQTAHYAVTLPAFFKVERNELPFLYESTGVETFFRNTLDPEPRSRRVFAFHKPETLMEWASQADTLRARLRKLPELLPPPFAGEGGGGGYGAHMRDCQIEAITNLEQSFATAHPRALIQMATGAGKTYTACAFTYRLIKHAGAKRVLFLVDRANLGRQAMAEFQQFVTSDTGRKFTELYNVQHLTSNQLDSVARVTICTIQRLYSMLRGEELDEDIDEKSGFELAAADDRPRDVAYNPTIPIETFDFIVTDECHRSIYNLWRQVLEYFDAFLIGLTATLLRAIDPDAIAEQAAGTPGASPADVAPDAFEAARQQLIAAACAPFDSPALRDALAKAKQEAEQTIDTVTIDIVTHHDYDAAAKEKAANLLKSFRAYIELHRAEITALQILYSRPYRQRLTETMLKELEKKLRDTNATWNEENLWNACASAAPGKVKGRSAVNRFADLVPLVRFALEQQPVLEPFAESVNARFASWLAQKAGAGVTFTANQRVWLELIRDHIGTSLSIEPEDFDYAPFSQRGGLGRAAQLFGDQLPKLLDELNEALAA